MSDNVLVTPGTGDTIAADDIASAKYQRIKLIHGADGVNAGDVATGNPLPVVQTGTPALPTGAATLAAQTQPGVDIGDVTINNASGASAVNIQDGGNSITVDGTVTTTPPSNASTNVAQLAGTTTDTNSGSKSAGTLRVVLATDQPALTNKLLVTPDSVALPANQSVNISQVAGATISQGHGTAATGIRVELPTDGTGVVGLNAGSAIVGKVGIDQTTPGTTNLIALTAETTKAIGVVRNSDGAGNLLTSNSTTPSAKFSLDQNITSILGTAPTAVGKLDVKGADGDVFVRQTTGSNLHTVLDSGTLTTLTTLTGTTSLTPGTGAANLGKAEDSPHASTDTGVFVLAVGNEAQTVLAADGDYIAHGVDTKGNTLTVGNVANAAADAGFPLKIGGVGKTANPTAVSDGQRVNATFDKLGKQVTVGSIRDLKGNQVTTITSSTAETTIATAVASTFLDLYGLIVTNTSATSVNVAIKDATAGTTRLNIAVPAGDTRGFMVPEGGAIKQAVNNNNWTATSSGSVTSIIITALTVQNT